jgi:hypothetical protein
MVYQTLQIQGRKGGALPLIPAGFKKKGAERQLIKKFTRSITESS